jgi:hypothetical protein
MDHYFQVILLVLRVLVDLQIQGNLLHPAYLGCQLVLGYQKLLGHLAVQLVLEILVDQRVHLFRSYQ